VPGALWSRAMIDEERIRPVDSVTPISLPHFVRILISVDPQKELGEAAAETGIMVWVKLRRVMVIFLRIYL
jgi:hypothetical protein